MRESGKNVLKKETELTYFIMEIHMSDSTNKVMNDLVLGKPCGYGQYFWNNGSVYSGEFDNGVKSGFGRWRKSKDYITSMYEGQYVNDKKEGFGIFKWASGNKYVGHYVNDEREGIGKMIWTDGSYYIGEWKNGIQHGYGRMYFPDGTVKEGLFYRNVFKGTEGLNTYIIPKELTDPDFDIMKYITADMKFSDEILEKRSGPTIDTNSTIYTAALGRKRYSMNSSVDTKRSFTVKGRQGRQESTRRYPADNRMKSVAESPYKIRVRGQRTRRMKKTTPRGFWIPAGRSNQVKIGRIPGGIY